MVEFGDRGGVVLMESKKWRRVVGRRCCYEDQKARSTVLTSVSLTAGLLINSEVARDGLLRRTACFEVAYGEEWSV